uniref:Reverse transcriptase domain-containing protein n=1 Tax=Panagrellus redivivus TaxID=6233 RepID=A0A7E4ZSN9_PANRE
MFTKVMRPFLADLRNRGVNCALYLDDLIFWHRDESCAQAHAELIKQVAQAAGIMINEAKSVFQVQKSVTWLGVVVDFHNARISITEERIEKTIRAARWLKRQGKPNIKDRLRFTGLLVSTHQVLGPFAAMSVKELFHTIAAAAPMWYGRLPLARAEIDEFNFCIRNVKKFNKCELTNPSKRVAVIETDASAVALGAVRVNPVDESALESKSRPMATEERDQSSACRELLAIQFAMGEFKEKVKGSRLVIRTDSANAVAILRKGSMSRLPQAIALQITMQAKLDGIELNPVWIPREENKRADEASRILDPDDWQIQDWLFAEIQRKFKTDLDAFATHITTKHKQFYCATYCPGAKSVDALSVEWTKHKVWAVPPPRLLTKVWNHVRSHPCEGILMVPDWGQSVAISCLKQALSEGWAQIIHRTNTADALCSGRSQWESACAFWG